MVIEVIKKAIGTLSGLYIAAYTEENEMSNFYCRELLPPEEIELILFIEEDPVIVLSKLEMENYKKRIADMELKLKRIKFNLKIKTKVLNTSLIKAADDFMVYNR